MTRDEKRQIKMLGSLFGGVLLFFVLGMVVRPLQTDLAHTIGVLNAKGGSAAHGAQYELGSGFFGRYTVLVTASVVPPVALYRSASRVEAAIALQPEFDPELRLRLVHAILAHHGLLEHGSPVLPMTPEAILLHNADKLDGDLRGAIDHLERAVDEANAFTERSFMHETRLYRGTQEDTPPLGQASLW